MENVKVSKSVETSDATNQSSTGADTVERLVDELQPSSLLDEQNKINAVVEHHYHENLDVKKLKNSSSNLQIKETTVDDLNEDCLLEIFSYLSYEIMMQVKEVSKKWYDVSQHWFKQIQKIRCFIHKPGVIKAIFYKNNSKHRMNGLADFYSNENIIAILESCGHHIKYYYVEIPLESRDYKSYNHPFYGTYFESRENYVFDLIPNLCRNIVDFTLDIFEPIKYDTSLYFATMAKHWRKLEKINIRTITKSRDENLIKLFQNNKKLKTLELWFRNYSLNNNTACDEYFTDLPPTMEELIIRDMEIDGKKNLNNFILASKNFTLLKSLEMSHLNYLTDAMVAAIVDIKSLTRLSLIHVIRFESHKTLDPIANMKALKSLELSGNNHLREDSFIKIIKSCTQLEQLEIHSGSWLTDKGMAAIADLKKLKYLMIDATHVTSGSIINSCDNLETFWCFDSEINNIESKIFLEKATNLRFLRFIRCRNLTHNLIFAANKIANQRKKSLCIKNASRDFKVKDINTPYFTYSYDYFEILEKININREFIFKM